MVNWEAKPWDGIGPDIVYVGKKHIGAINFIFYFPAYLLPCQEWSHIPHNLISSSNIEDHLPEPFSPFALCRRQEEPASDLPSGGAPVGKNGEITFG